MDYPRKETTYIMISVECHLSSGMTKIGLLASEYNTCIIADRLV